MVPLSMLALSTKSYVFVLSYQIFIQLVPPPELSSESDVEDYLNELSDSDNESAFSCSE